MQYLTAEDKGSRAEEVCYVRHLEKEVCYRKVSGTEDGRLLS